MLGLGFDPRRARRTHVLVAEGSRLQADFPDEFATILAGAVDPLIALVWAVPDADPELDAWSIYAITWELVEAKLRGSGIDRRDRARPRPALLPPRWESTHSDGPAAERFRVLRHGVRDDATAQLESLQEELLLEMLPYAYEHTAVIRETWDDGGVHPPRHHDRSRNSASAHRSSTRTRSAASATNAAIRRGAVRASPRRTDSGDVDLRYHRRPDPRAREVGQRSGRPSIITRDFWGMGVRPGFRKFDHISIFLLIAGTYTPFCLVALNGWLGWTIFGVVWSCAVAGIVFKSIHIGKLELLSTIMYVMMGWIIIFAIKPLWGSMTQTGFVILVLGGISYSAGTLFFIKDKIKYFHSIWHVFVLGGSILHFFAVMTLLP